MLAKCKPSQKAGAKPAHPSFAPTKNLSPRELEVLLARAKGKPLKTISDELELSMGTVKTYLRLAFCKLGAASSLEAVDRLRELEAN